MSECKYMHDCMVRGQAEDCVGCEPVARIEELEYERTVLIARIGGLTTGQRKQDTQNTALEAKLKAAEDHAATMETCARDAEEKLALEEAKHNVRRALYSEERERRERLETELAVYKEAFKVVEAEMLERVPFEVVKKNCKHFNAVWSCVHPKKGGNKTCTEQTCPLIPKEGK